MLVWLLILYFQTHVYSAEFSLVSQTGKREREREKEKEKVKRKKEAKETE